MKGDEKFYIGEKAIKTHCTAHTGKGARIADCDRTAKISWNGGARARI